MLVPHDDAKREYAYAEPKGESLKASAERGWTGVSMRGDWHRVFADDKENIRSLFRRLLPDDLEVWERVRELAPRWATPTLLLWAGADRCVAPAGSAGFAAPAPTELLQARCFDGLFHEIFNEPEQADVFGVLHDWLDTLELPAQENAR